MDFELSDDLLALQDVARRFAADHIAPNARDWDREASIPRETVKKLAELGFLGIFTLGYRSTDDNYGCSCLYGLGSVFRIYSTSCGNRNIYFLINTSDLLKRYFPLHLFIN